MRRSGGLWAVAMGLLGACGGGPRHAHLDAGVPLAGHEHPADAATRAAPDAGPDGGALAGLPPNRTCRAPGQVDAAAPVLSATGCVDPADPRRPAPGLVAYEVASPLWSDGAAKERFLALPPGTKIRVKDCTRAPDLCGPRARGGTPGDDGHLDLPDGTVLMKSFVLGGRHVETRLLVRFDRDTWGGYSYEWNEEQTDARLLPDSLIGERRTVRTPAGALEWYFPSRAECLRCHTDAAGVALGAELAQLDREVVDRAGVHRDQLEVLEGLGLFEAPLPRLRPAALPDPAGPGPVADRARAYLHANCANCHRPGGNFSSFDLRHRTPLAAMNICDVPPERGDLGVSGARIFAPGQPGRSILWLRMRALAPGERMPQLGSHQIDAAGTALVAEWIRSIRACR